nr:P-II family nitrogen regulator [Campylobacter sp.]
PKLKIEIAVKDELLQKVIDAILKSAKTGSTGDGKIFVRTIDEVIRIRTGEKDDEAI